MEEKRKLSLPTVPAPKRIRQIPEPSVALVNHETGVKTKVGTMESPSGALVKRRASSHAVLSAILDDVETMLKMPHEAWSIVRNLLDRKDSILPMIMAARSPDDIAIRARRLPAGLADLPPKHLVEEHFVQLLHLSPDFGARPNPLRKFLQRPNDVLVTRLALDPSLQCSSLLPAVARKDPETLMDVGGHWLEASNFVVGEEFLGHQAELECLRDLAARFSREGRSGYSRVRSLTIPGFSAASFYGNKYVRLCVDFTGLRELLLGFQPQDLYRNCKDPQLPDVAEYVEDNNIDELLTTVIHTFTIAKGPPTGITPPVVTAGMDQWLCSLATLLKGRLVAAHRPSVKVLVDFDTHWDQAGSGLIREVEVDARGDVIPWLTVP